MRPTIREANEKDKDRLATLAIDLYKGDAYASKDLVGNFGEIVKEQWSKLVLGQYLLFVAELGGEVIGYIKGRIVPNISLFTNEKVGFIDEFIVHAAHRGCGVGRALLTTLENAMQKDVDRVVLNTGAGGPAALFYEKAGFNTIAYRMVKFL